MSKEHEKVRPEWPEQPKQENYTGKDEETEFQVEELEERIAPAQVNIIPNVS